MDYLLGTLMGNVQADMYEISCHGIGMMTLCNEAVKDLTAGKCVKNILGRSKESFFLEITIQYHSRQCFRYTEE